MKKSASSLLESKPTNKRVHGEGIEKYLDKSNGDSVERGLMTLIVGHEHIVDRALEQLTCEARFEKSVGAFVIELDFREGAEKSIAVDEVKEWIVRNGGVMRNSTAWPPAFFFEGENDVANLKFYFRRGEATTSSMLTFDYANTRAALAHKTEPIHGSTIHEVMTKTLQGPAMFPPNEFVFMNTFMEWPYPIVCPIKKIDEILTLFNRSQVCMDVIDAFDGKYKIAAATERANEVMRIMRAKCDAIKPTADGIENCRREAYKEALADAPKESVERVLSKRCFFDTYAAAMGYHGRRVDHPSFIVEIMI